MRPDNPLLEGTGIVPLPKRVRHVKTGGIYRILVTATVERDMSQMVMYQSEHDGRTWLRPVEEFCDGRFVPVSD